jgi:hypothetical protein
VTYTVGDDKTKLNAINNGDGTYTIPGDKITGKITVDYDTITGSFEYVSFQKYRAMAFNEQLAILKTEKRTDGNTYELKGSKYKFYWSDKYGGYVIFVSDTETDTTLTAKLSVVEGTAQEIAYGGSTTADGRVGGDIDGNGTVDQHDGGMIMDIIRNVMSPKNLTYPVGDVMRLMLDVDGDKVVANTDAQWTVEEGLHLSHTNSN